MPCPFLWETPARRVAVCLWPPPRAISRVRRSIVMQCACARSVASSDEDGKAALRQEGFLQETEGQHVRGNASAGRRRAKEPRTYEERGRRAGVADGEGGAASRLGDVRRHHALVRRRVLRGLGNRRVCTTG